MLLRRYPLVVAAVAVGLVGLVLLLTPASWLVGWIISIFALLIRGISPLRETDVSSLRLVTNTGGNPGEYREDIHVYGLGSIIVGYLRNAATFDPSVSGSIVSLAYSYDTQRLQLNTGAVAVEIKDSEGQIPVVVSAAPLERRRHVS